RRLSSLRPVDAWALSSRSRSTWRPVRSSARGCCGSGREITCSCWGFITSSPAAVPGSVCLAGSPRSTAPRPRPHAPAPPPLPPQYLDSAGWQREQPEPRSDAPDRTYWMSRLAGSLPLLDPPADHPRPDVLTYRGSRIPVHVPADVVDRLRAVGRRE